MIDVIWNGLKIEKLNLDNNLNKCMKWKTARFALKQ